MPRLADTLISLLSCATLVGACAGASKGDGRNDAGGAGGAIGGGGGAGRYVPPDATFTYDATSADAATCADLKAKIRDFRQSPGPNNEPAHPDFNTFLASVKGIVKPELGVDRKPIYAAAGPTAVTTGPAEFAQWYNDVDGVNLPFEITIPLAPDATRPGVFVYASSAFFPIDDQGFGNQYQSHNYSFTTEIHTQFQYKGGESFTFKGDDDVWVFVNGKLVMDLGGVHTVETGTVNMDEQGLTVDEYYNMDVFHAERHLADSNFRMETTIACFIPIVIP